MRRISNLILLSLTLISMPAVYGAESSEPFRIIDNIYWVGSTYGSYLITTPEGHILHDTGSNAMHDVIVSNVEKLGFDVQDIKIMISSHAHWDHVQGHRLMQQLTGAQVIALGGDAAALESGRDNSAGGFPGLEPVMVDRVIEDGDTVTLGDVTLSALWTPGHTQGATVWMTTVEEEGNSYFVAFRGGEIPNDGLVLFGNPRHPSVVEDTRMTLQRLKELTPPDLLLHNHPQNLGRPLDAALPVNPACFTCLDAEGWTNIVENSEARFADNLREAERNL